MNISRRACLRLTTAALLSPLAPRTFAADPKPDDLRVVLLSGSAEYHSDESLAALAADWTKRFRVRCTQLNAKDSAGDPIPNIDALDSADLVLVFTRRLRPPKDQLAVFQKYCDTGKPVIGIRTASHAFEDWLVFDKQVLGGNYQSHYKPGPVANVTIAQKAKDHPILAGISPFTSPGSLYRNTPLPDDSEPLLTGSIPDHTEPIAWTHSHKGGRVFYTSLGVPEDFKNETFRKLLDNALAWTTQHDPQTLKR
jgi:type 1 glutamine amidotransferase